MLGSATRGLIHNVPTASSSIGDLARRDRLTAEERFSVKLHSNDPLYRCRVQKCRELAAVCQSQATERHVTLSVGSLATLCSVY